MDTAQITGALGTLIVGIVGYAVRELLSRISKIEDELDEVLTKNEVRELLTDNLEPVKQDIKDLRDDFKEIKNTLNQLFTLYLKDRN